MPSELPPELPPELRESGDRYELVCIEEVKPGVRVRGFMPAD
jgi:hypothetical protein